MHWISEQQKLKVKEVNQWRDNINSTWQQENTQTGDKCKSPKKIADNFCLQLEAYTTGQTETDKQTTLKVQGNV